MIGKLNKRKKDNKKKGFTLVELIVVVAILGILAMITIPRFSQYVEQARMQKIESNARIVYEAAVAAEAELVANGEVNIWQDTIAKEASKSLPGLSIIGIMPPEGCEPGTYSIYDYEPATDTEGSYFKIVYYGEGDEGYTFDNGVLADKNPWE